MAREDRTREYSLLDRENLRSGVDIGAELFGIGVKERVAERGSEQQADHGKRAGEGTPPDAMEMRPEPEDTGKLPSGNEREAEAVLPVPPQETKTATGPMEQPKEATPEPEPVPVQEPAPAPAAYERQSQDRVGEPVYPRRNRPESNQDFQEWRKEPLVPDILPGPEGRDGAPYRREAKREDYRYRYPSLEQPEPGFKTFRRLIVNVYSPKGGVGKSSISKELAVAYSTASINQVPLKVLIVDADWEFGDISTLFNISPRPNVTDWIRDMMMDKRQTGHIHLYSRQEIAARYVIPYRENLHILAGPGDPTEAELVTEEMVTAIMESLRRSDYDVIVIDSANSNRMRSLVPLMKADAVVLVETLDTSTVAETTAVLNTLRTQQFDFGKLYMVLNQVPNSDAGMDISVAEISRLLQLDIAAVIPRYEMLRMINNAGEAAVLKKSTPFSRAIFQLANRIVPVFEQEKKKGIFSGILGIFGRKR